MSNYKILVNKEHKLGKDYVPTDLIYIKKEYEFSSEERLSFTVYKKYLEFKEYAKEHGINIYINSGYRSYSYQFVVWNYFIEKIGLENTKKRVAFPGTSEHQTGLAIDLGIEKDGTDIDMDEKTALWLENNSYMFGFILRYPNNKEDITGFQYEPWHFRYVGLELALYLRESNLTLEEYYKEKNKEQAKEKIK